MTRCACLKELLCNAIICNHYFTLEHLRIFLSFLEPPQDPIDLEFLGVRLGLGSWKVPVSDVKGCCVPDSLSWMIEKNVPEHKWAFSVYNPWVCETTEGSHRHLLLPCHPTQPLPELPPCEVGAMAVYLSAVISATWSPAWLLCGFFCFLVSTESLCWR